MDALMTNIINNLIHGLWFYSLVLEPKHNRKKTLEILATGGDYITACHAVSFWVDASSGIVFSGDCICKETLFMRLLLDGFYFWDGLCFPAFGFQSGEIVVSDVCLL